MRIPKRTRLRHEIELSCHRPIAGTQVFFDRFNTLNWGGPIHRTHRCRDRRGRHLAGLTVRDHFSKRNVVLAKLE